MENIQFTLPVSILKEEDSFIAYSPALDLSTVGGTFDEAKGRFEEAVQIFFEELDKKGITAVPIWQLGQNPGKMIATAARELGVKTVMIGTTRRSALVNLLRGNIFRTLAHHLPKHCRLVISG